MSSGKTGALYIPICLFVSANAVTAIFCQVIWGEEIRSRYLKTLQQEIRGRRHRKSRITELPPCISAEGHRLCCPAEKSGTLMDCIAAGYSLEEDVEITMEGNPGTFTGQKLQGWKKRAGVNRLSIGCQSVLNRGTAAAGPGSIHSGEFQKSFREGQRSWI